MALDTDLLQAWWKATPPPLRPANCRTEEKVIYKIPEWRKRAQGLVSDGLTIDDVADYCAQHIQRKPDEPLYFGTLANELPAWARKHGASSATADIDPDAPPGPAERAYRRDGWQKAGFHNERTFREHVARVRYYEQHPFIET